MDIMKWYQGFTNSYDALLEVAHDDKGGLLGFNFSPHAGYIYIIAKGNTPSRVIHVKKASDSFQKPKPFVERPYEFRFEYNTTMPLKDALKIGLVPLATYEVDMRALGEKEEEAKDIQKMCLVRIVEPKRTYILRNSICSFMVDVFDTEHTGMRFFFNYSMKTKPSKAIDVRVKYPEGNEHLIISGMMKEALEERLSQEKRDSLRCISKNGLREIVTLILAAINEKIGVQGLYVEYAVKTFEVPFKKAQEMFDAKVDVEKQAEKNKETISASIAEAASIKNKGIASNAVALDKEKTVGAAEIDNIAKGLKALEIYEVAMSTVVSTEKVAIAKQIGKIKGTYVAGSSNMVADDPVIAAMKARIILKQQGGQQGAT